MRRSANKVGWKRGYSVVCKTTHGGSIPPPTSNILTSMPVRLKRKKGNKYNAKKVVVDGITFDSEKESKRYLFLKQAQADGLISGLELQPKFELIPPIKEIYIKHLKTKDKVCERTVQLPITYKGDFSYIKDGVRVIEDVKASPHIASLDKAFLIKEKLFRYLFGFSIKRIYSSDAEV